jgi:thiol-disulfide isomerase/thioredoxin
MEVATPADTVMVIKFFSSFTYMINESDSLYQMNFRYEKREKSFNFDRLKSLVYNGQYFYSVEKIENDIIPTHSYRIQDLSTSTGKLALSKSIQGQIPYIFKQLSTIGSKQIKLKPDSIIGGKLFNRLAFMADPIYEFEVWIDNETKMPARVIKIAHINRKKPQIVETTEISNYQYIESVNGEIIDEYLVDQFNVNENTIQYIPDKNGTIPTLLKKGKAVPELSDITVFNKNINITASNKKVKLLYFGMINCCPCIKSIPYLKEINNRFRDNNRFEMMAFYPYDPPSILKKYVKKEELTFPVCAGGKEVVSAFGLHAYPDILLTDINGKVYKWYNYSEDMDDVLIADILKLLQWHEVNY